MESEVTLLPDSPNGVQALSTLDEPAQLMDETPDRCSEGAATIIRFIETLSSITSGLVARDIADLLKDRNRPIRELSCLCP
jgi:hypothetical protein